MPGGNPFNGRYGPDICIDRDIGEQYKVIKAVYDALLDGRIPAFLAAIADDQSQILDVINATFFAKVDVDCSGNQDVILTEAQYSKGLINLTGTLTANINVVFPNSGRWVTFNTSFGAHTITVKTADGDGVALPNGKSRPVFADGVNMVDDAFEVTNLNGLASEAWVQALGYITAASLVGYATQAWVTEQIPAGVDLTGYATEAWADGQFDALGAAAAAQVNAYNHADTGDTATWNHADAQAAAAQTAAIAAAAAHVASLFSSSYAATGYFNVNGFIIQWCLGSTSTGNGDTVFFPEAFPNACLGVVPVEAAAGGWASNPTAYGSDTWLPGSCKIYGMKCLGASWEYAAGLSYFLIAVGF